MGFVINFAFPVFATLPVHEKPESEDDETTETGGWKLQEMEAGEGQGSDATQG